ncbi:hypothetical protein CEP54_012100 [Fusarium duplospermum]|uniref:Uncharacterized protein n=1 Tax=Fusarium duplospermum TaxID=1325734 RepID=A0A428PAH5_9HYPO|nr:hypothetical protein CEP54_012100 [Fusarium duplospermum]
MTSTASSSTDRSPRQQHVMASIKRPAHNIEEWIQLSPDTKPRNERIVEASSILLRALADWELKGECPYLTERDEQLKKLTAVQDIIQNSPETTPEEGIALQNKINKLRFEGDAVSLWLDLSDAERMNICRVFDRQNCFKGHQMEKRLLERLSEVEKVKVRSKTRDLRELWEHSTN